MVTEQIVLNFRCLSCGCEWKDETLYIDSYLRYETTYLKASSGMRFRVLCPNLGIRCIDKTKLYCREIEAHLIKKEVDARLSFDIQQSI